MAQTKDENSIRFSWNSDGDQTATTTRDSRTPSLVSFVGQSGAGKSTLINLLITFKGGVSRGAWSTPVVGMTGKDVPTSEDVHLYPDPASVSFILIVIRSELITLGLLICAHALCRLRRS
jgi:ABC-type hemin transport system ATPase subunit